MAAIDFPSPASAGQIFRAPNGVTYQYDITRGVWIAQPSSQPNIPPGDFCAVQTDGVPTIGTSYATLIPNVVLSGNVGGWYSLSTGRYTPPAGRYAITAGLQGSTSGGITTVGLMLRKNGVKVMEDQDTGAGGSYRGNPHISVTVDMNGTDWLDLQGQSANATGNVHNMSFQSIPVGTVVQMPAQQQGDFYAYTNAAGVPTSAYATVLFNSVLSGNSGGWYNSSNGRYTPPAGRYKLQASLFGNLSTGATQITATIRKNGTSVTTTAPTTSSAGANYWCETTFDAIVDANGTDWFDVQGAAGAGGVSQSMGWFSAFPTAGVQGPPGPPGSVLPPGVVVDFAGPVANVPAGWYPCDGSTKLVANEPALFAAIGYTHGGSGANFNLPDYGGRVSAGREGTATRLTAAISGVNSTVIGAVGGDQRVPNHVHSYFGGASPLTWLNVGQGGVANFTASGSNGLYSLGSTTDNPTGANAGGGSANIGPIIIVNKIIKA